MAEAFKKKSFYEQHFDPKLLIEEYHREGSPFTEDSLTFPLKWLIKIFTTCGVKGDTLTGICAGGIYQYITACDYFKEIIASDFTDRNVKVLDKWLKKDPEAIDWTPILKYACELEGDSEKWPEKGETLRRKVQNVLRYDIYQSNPFAPNIVPQADCLLIGQCMELLCPTKESYSLALKNISSLLKVGGYLVMIGAIGCTFFMLGKCKFPVQCIGEKCVREVVCDNGYEIIELTINPRQENQLYSITDADALYFLAARKIRADQEFPIENKESD